MNAGERMLAYRAARKWAAEHGHAQPDDRMIDVALDAMTAPSGTVGQCSAIGPDGLRCGRAPGHQPLVGDANDHAAYADESGELVRW